MNQEVVDLSQQTDGEEFTFVPDELPKETVQPWIDQADYSPLGYYKQTLQNFEKYDAPHYVVKTPTDITKLDWHFDETPLDGSCGPTSLACAIWERSTVSKQHSMCVRRVGVAHAVHKWHQYKDDCKDGIAPMNEYINRMSYHKEWVRMDNEMRAIADAFGFGIAFLHCERPNVEDCYWHYVQSIDNVKEKRKANKWCIILYDNSRHFETCIGVEGSLTNVFYWFTWEQVRQLRVLPESMKTMIYMWKHSLFRRTRDCIRATTESDMPGVTIEYLPVRRREKKEREEMKGDGWEDSIPLLQEKEEHVIHVDDSTANFLEVMATLSISTNKKDD